MNLTIHTIAFLASTIYLTLFSNSFAQETVIIPDGETFHLNNAPPGGRVTLLEPNMMETYDSRVIAALLGIKLSKTNAQDVTFEFTTRRSSDLQGALFRAERNGHKSIYYNIYLFNDGDKTTGSRYFAFAHELGHYVCGHAKGKRFLRPSKALELEADRFAGAALKRANDLWRETSLERLMPAIRRSLDDDESESHPSADERVRAITAGYRDGSPCVFNGKYKVNSY